MRQIAYLPVTASFVLALSTRAALAQDVNVALPPDDMFARDRNISVLDRQNPEYAPEPIPIGSFTLDPSITTQIDYDSNIFAQANNAESDEIVQLKPAVVLQSDWSRNLFNLTLQGDQSWYLQHPAQNTTDGGASTYYRWDIYHNFGLAAGADYEEDTQSRTAINEPYDSVKPIQYTYGDAFLNAVEQDDRFRFALRGDLQDYTFQNGQTASGATVYQRDQSYSQGILTGRVSYAYFPDAALYLQGSANREWYRNPLPGEQERNSTGYSGEIGTNLDLTNLVRGEFGVGYLAQNYQAPIYSNISGLGASAKLTYFMTTLVDISLNISRSIGNAVIPGVSGYLATTIGGEVDYELLRNLKIAATAGYENDAFHDYDRTDNRVSAGIGATWLLNRALSAKVGFSYYQLKSTGIERVADYNIEDITASVTYHF